MLRETLSYTISKFTLCLNSFLSLYFVFPAKGAVFYGITPLDRSVETLLGYFLVQHKDMK